MNFTQIIFLSFSKQKKKIVKYLKKSTYLIYIFCQRTSFDTIIFFILLSKIWPMLSDGLSFQQKFRFINKPIQQLCRIHQKQAIYFCAKNDCQKYTFLCDRCRRQNIHNHVDQIQQFKSWMQNIAQKINALKNNKNRLFQSQLPQKQQKNDFSDYVNELKRVYGIIENIEKRVIQAIRDVKSDIGNRIRTYQNYGQGRLLSKIGFYSNPYLLVNKVNSERNDNFVQQLKKMFRGDSDMVDTFNSKKELIKLQNNLKSIITSNQSQIFNKAKDAGKIPYILIAQKNILQCQCKPESLFEKGDVLMVGFQNFTQIVSISSKQLLQRLEVTFSKCSSLIVDGNCYFAAISSKTSNQLHTFILKKLQTTPFDFKIYSVLLFCNNSKFYCILGKDSGKIVIYDFQKKAIIDNLNDGYNSNVQFIQLCDGDTKLLTSGKNTPINVYKIILKSQQIFFQRQQPLKLQVQDLQQIKAYGSYIILLTAKRNIYVYDIVMKLHYKTNYLQNYKEFDMVTVLEQTDNYLVVVTHNQGESWLHSWKIQKNGRYNQDSIKMQRIYFSNRGQILIFLQMNGNNIWVVRQEDKHKLVNYNLVVT